MTLITVPVPLTLGSSSDDNKMHHMSNNMTQTVQMLFRALFLYRNKVQVYNSLQMSLIGCSTWHTNLDLIQIFTIQIHCWKLLVAHKVHVWCVLQVCHARNHLYMLNLARVWHACHSHSGKTGRCRFWGSGSNPDLCTVWSAPLPHIKYKWCGLDEAASVLNDLDYSYYDSYNVFRLNR